MVSGFLTSPCDHRRMSSAAARPIRSSSKKLTSSTCVSSTSARCLCLMWTDFGSDFVDAHRTFVRTTRQVDAQLLGGAEHLVVGLAHLQGHAVAGEHLDVEAQRLELLEQHLERLRDSRLGDVLALDDGLVHLDPAQHV